VFTSTSYTNCAAKVRKGVGFESLLTLLIRVHRSGSPPEEKHRISLSAPITALQHFTTNDSNPNNNTPAPRQRLPHKPTPPPSNKPSRAANKHPNPYTNHTQHIPTAKPPQHRCHPKHPRPRQQNPCPIHTQNPYHNPHTASARKPVNKHHTSWTPSPQNTTKGHCNRYRNASPAVGEIYFRRCFLYPNGVSLPACTGGVRRRTAATVCRELTAQALITVACLWRLSGALSRLWEHQ